jgi:WD40 repeat protein
MTSVDGAPMYFICYSRAQDEFVTKIETKLSGRRNRRELSLFRDTHNIESFELFDQVIRAAISVSVGAIVLVSDEWHASPYVQNHEWPAISRKYEDTGGAFGVFAICFHELDDTDPLRTHDFVNDLSRELMVGADDRTRDVVLTRLSNVVGGHANAIAPASPLPVVPVIEPGPWPAPQGTGLATPTELRPGIHGVPELPVGFVAPSELDPICRALRGGALAAVAGVRGEGGTGKSVLAAAAARELSSEFSGGVHWVTVGERATEEDVRRLQADLLNMIGAPPADPLIDFHEGRAKLAEALAARPALMVVDDVWQRWQVLAFDVVQPGSPARLLFTSRFPEVFPTRSEAFDLARLDDREATLFLRETVGLPTAPEDTAAVLEAAGGLRLALAVMAAVVRTTGTWVAVVSRLDGLAERFGSGDDASSAHKLLHVAADTLTADDRRLLHTLGAFPPDAEVPVDLLRRVWRVDPEAANATVQRLVDVGLVAREPGGVALHDHAHDYVVIAATEPLLATQVRLWELAKNWRTSGGWSQVRSESAYLWDRLVWHACRAELNNAELRGIALDHGWLVDRIRFEGVAAAQQDVAEICQRTGATDDDPIGQMRRCLLHGAIFDAAAANRGLEASVSAWHDVSGVTTKVVVASGGLPVPSGALLRTLTGHRAQLRGVAFSHDGARLVTASDDATAGVWDTATGQVVAVLKGHRLGLQGVAFNHDGSRIATASADGTARLWDPVTADTVAILEGHPGWVLSVAFSGDDSLVATSGDDRTVRLWNALTGQPISTFEGGPGWVHCVAFSPDGSRIATASADGKARVWDASTGQIVGTLDGHAQRLRGVAFNSDGSRIATASTDGTARVWDASTGETVCTLDGHTGELFGVAFDDDGSRVATAGADGTARLWDTQTGESVGTLEGHTGEVFGVAFNRDGSLVATVSADETLRVWDATAAQAVGAAPVDVFGLTKGVAFNHDGSRVATVSADGFGRVWDAVTSQLVATLDGPVRAMAFNHDSSRIATASVDGVARVWDAASRQIVNVLEGHADWVLGVVFNHDGSLVATGSADKKARVWDAVTGQIVATLEGHLGWVHGVAFNHDGSLVATASDDNAARLWDPLTGQAITAFEGHSRWVRGVAFNHDGSRVATASDDSTARLWDPATGQTVVALAGHAGWVRGVAFNRDGSRVATASADGSARVWDSNTGECLLTLALACSGQLDWRDHRLVVGAGRHWAVIVPPPSFVVVGPE